MAQTEFKFNSDSGESFTVVSFTATEGISQLYRYEIELKAPLARAIDINDILDDPATFITIEDTVEYPVHGILASLDEIKTAQNYVYYKAVLVPQLWKLSIYKTNEIYTTEKTVDKIIQTVLENTGLVDGTDFELGHLDNSNFLIRDYVCQFGESDFDFVSRLMENEGIFYYYDQSGTQEKIIFVNDDYYGTIDQPDIVYESGSSLATQHKHISAWACRIQRLPASVSVRDYNPGQPSLDIAGTVAVDVLGTGTEYQYGGHIIDGTEAANISEIRADELKCNKIRYYGESSVSRFKAGYCFALDTHPNTKYNGLEYLLIEINHHGTHLDMAQLGQGSEHQSTYHNSFVAIEKTIQFRPPRQTPKPRFYGTMTAFIHAETGTTRPEVNEFGEYRVHLPFDRADGTKLSTDPDRKASAWMRMAQPYVGQDQGMYFPLTGGTEVLLTFINGDPDQPIISAALPNAAQPSLMQDNPEWASMVTNKVTQNISGNTHNISMNSGHIQTAQNDIQANSDSIDDIIAELTPSTPIPTTPNSHFINGAATVSNGSITANGGVSMIPPWYKKTTTDPTPAYDDQFVKFKYYDHDFNATDMIAEHLDKCDTDRSAGDNYVYANARTFAYPQHERVYFIGTFHEDFHTRDGFMEPTTSGTGIKEQWNFPAPGEDYPSGTEGDKNSDTETNPNGLRGVSEDKRWGDQMFYAWGRSFNWSGGSQMGDGGAFGVFNYGNGYTENLIAFGGGTISTNTSSLTLKDQWDFTTSWKPSAAGGLAGALGVANKGLKTGLDFVQDPVTGILKILNLDVETLAEATELDPAITAAEKTVGHTYSYHMGLAVDIHEGNSISRTYGDSEEVVHGDSETVVKGDSYETVIGTSNSFFMGAKSEIAFSVDSEIKLALDSTVQLGGVVEVEIAGKTGLSATWEKMLYNRQDKISSNESKTTAKNLENSLNTVLLSLQHDIKSLKVSVQAAGIYSVDATGIVLSSKVGTKIMGAFVNIG